MDNLVALEGAFLIERAVSAELVLEALYCVPAREAWARSLIGRASAAPDAGGAAAALEPTVLPEARISEIAGYKFHRGAYALARRPVAHAPSDVIPAPSEPCTVLVLPEIGDPENLGASFRNATALGCSALLLGPSGPDPYCRRALRVSMGSTLSLPWARLADPSAMGELAARGFRAVACVLAPDAPELRAWQCPSRLALVLGNEAFGLSEPWLEACQERVTLKMQGSADSLNVATAAAIFLYATARRREAPDALAI
jgi:tRNA G18 (ribose-2'-O)-methylase SpoU